MGLGEAVKPGHVPMTACRRDSQGRGKGNGGVGSNAGAHALVTFSIDRIADDIGQVGEG